MKWTQSQPIPAGIWTTAQIAYHLRLDPDLANSSDEQAYLTDLQNTAVEAAEELMGCSLLTRTVTAEYFGPNAGFSFGYGWSQTYYNNHRNRLRLPRGPVQSITSASDANGVISSGKYTLGADGVRDYIELDLGWTQPLTVVYVAGWGSSVSQVPADIRQAIRLHVATLYENRESIGVGKSSDAIPQSLADFYRSKSRNLGIG